MFTEQILIFLKELGSAMKINLVQKNFIAAYFLGDLKVRVFLLLQKSA